MNKSVPNSSPHKSLKFSQKFREYQEEVEDNGQELIVEPKHTPLENV